MLPCADGDVCQGGSGRLSDVGGAGRMHGDEGGDRAAGVLTNLTLSVELRSAISSPLPQPNAPGLSCSMYDQRASSPPRGPERSTVSFPVRCYGDDGA